MIQRMLCCVFGHKWTTVAAGFPKLQCMYCERVTDCRRMPQPTVGNAEASTEKSRRLCQQNPG